MIISGEQWETVLILTWPPFLLWSFFPGLLFPIALFQPHLMTKLRKFCLGFMSFPPYLTCISLPSGKPVQRKVRPLMVSLESTELPFHTHPGSKWAGSLPARLVRMPSRKHKTDKVCFTSSHWRCPFRLVSFGKIWIFKYNAAFSQKCLYTVFSK